MWLTCAIRERHVELNREKEGVGKKRRVRGREGGGEGGTEGERERREEREREGDRRSERGMEEAGIGGRKQEMLVLFCPALRLVTTFFFE